MEAPKFTENKSATDDDIHSYFKFGYFHISYLFMGTFFGYTLYNFKWQFQHSNHHYAKYWPCQKKAPHEETYLLIFIHSFIFMK